MKKSSWHDGDKEIPAEDEVLCILRVETRHESNEGFHYTHNFEIGYIFADSWYDERNHEKIECNGRKITHWMELPEIPE